MSKFSTTLGFDIEMDPQNGLMLSTFLDLTRSFSNETNLRLDYLWISDIELRCNDKVGKVFWIEMKSKNMSQCIFNLGSLRRRIIPGHDQCLVALKQSILDDRFYKMCIVGWDHDDTGIHLLADNS